MQLQIQLHLKKPPVTTSRMAPKRPSTKSKMAQLRPLRRTKRAPHRYRAGTLRKTRKRKSKKASRQSRATSSLSTAASASYQARAWSKICRRWWSRRVVRRATMMRRKMKIQWVSQLSLMTIQGMKGRKRKIDWMTSLSSTKSTNSTGSM